MSTLLRLSTPRLEKAVVRAFKVLVYPALSAETHRFTVRELRSALERRGMSDRDIHDLFFRIIDVLEPPSCPMTHCKNFGGAGAPMNCSLERVPGRCTDLKAFRQRQKEREKKAQLGAKATGGAQQ